MQPIFVFIFNQPSPSLFAQSNENHTFQRLSGKTSLFVTHSSNCKQEYWRC